ncbi:MAG: signal recognition particle-docking protein FtsY [gamma proteobacterium symbiont of Lucinoma myriamae]|nr:signal recognition particle-docking protein FtsY [gamma proteobacterium symbiont of Lucinoma myriamae]MCU7819873.1 signal recognition particle-docking protein FtsY [gamma proteobacterium symbiont of Lucinoma myriamae]MCU7831700.1 signal recognition particle-docking protein FtsY [gamma proteobacterium symbiont of Lucinoma myriamae]
MFSFLKRNKETSKKQNSSPDLPDSSDPSKNPDADEPIKSADSPESVNSPEPVTHSEETIPPEPENSPASNDTPETTQKGLFGRLKQRLSKTRSSITGGISNAILGKKEIDDDLLEEIETQLLVSDMGVEASMSIIENLTDRISRKQLSDADSLFQALEEEMNTLLEPVDVPFTIDSSKKPYVILMVGINGAGKTTTIGKLAKKFQNEGHSVMLAAGDTFRAAAVEQLQVWGERNNIPVIAQHTGADSASVIFDAIEAGKARNIDIVIADTAGRLHTQANLMDELAKVKRVAAKVDASAPHEIMLVVDAGTGQNALNQAEQFNKTVGLSGITVTKLDGTAKGGIIFAIAKKLQIPIRFIGVGESIDDLRPFNGKEFVSALLSRDSS